MGKKLMDINALIDNDWVDFLDRQLLEAALNIGTTYIEIRLY